MPPPGGSALPCTLWFDVEDLFEHAASSARPSGIQRAAHEIYRALWEEHGPSGRIRFVRHDRHRQTLRPVTWTSVAELFERLAAAPPPSPSPSRETAALGGGPAPDSWSRQLAGRLPPDLRHRLLAVARPLLQAGRALADLLGFLARQAAGAARRGPRRPVAADPAGDFAALAQPGDFLVVLGAPWTYPGYADLLRRAQDRFGLRLGLLVYDLIPIRRPEWSDRARARLLRAVFATLLPAADAVLAISRATAGDVERFAADSGIALRAPVEVIPLGSGFGAAAPAVASARLPSAGSYALFVSTLEARKNHLLLFRVWRRLLDDMPAEAVPSLVFVGRVGWLVDDLMRQMENADYLGGKIRLIEDASDGELASLYRGCRFTLFPSLYEGWGLPVTESLAFGKPCIAARGSSLPEAGGRLARYFDPECVTDAYDVIRAAIEAPDGLRAWEAEIARGFTPVPWRATAEAVRRGLLGEPVPEG